MFNTMLKVFVLYILAMIHVVSSDSPSRVRVHPIETSPGDYPWMARIVAYFSGPHWDYVQCSGVLVSPEYVLTTARCVVDSLGRKASRVIVQLGRHDVKNHREPGRENLLSATVHVHPQHWSSQNFDAALIELPRKVTTTVQVRPIGLPPDGICSTAYNSSLAEVDSCFGGMALGWRSASDSQLAFPQLQTTLGCIYLTVRNFSACSDTFDQTKLCAGGVNEQQACQVLRPGAPFMCPLPPSGDPVLTGIYSADPRHSDEESCFRPSEAVPSVFSRVCAIIGWMSLFGIERHSPDQIDQYQPGTYPLRLTGDIAGNGTYGFVEIYHEDSWGTVLGNLTSAEALVVCRSLGFSTAMATVGSGAALVSTKQSMPTWLSNVDCNGLETSLAKCNHPPFEASIGPSDAKQQAVTCEVVAAGGTPSPFSMGQLRLTGSAKKTSGYLQIFYDNQWGTICDDNFDRKAANVACRQLGFSNSSGVVMPDSPNRLLFPVLSETPIWLDNVRCFGNETTLLQCRANPFGDNDCSRSEDVAIDCDETVSGKVRLVGGETNSTGFVEVFMNGAWGSVCDDGFTGVDARVVCRQLGFNGSVGAVLSNTSSLEPSNATAILLDDVDCHGNESAIYQCGNIDWGNHNCDESENVAIRCFNANESADANGQLRLTGSSTNTSGFLEILHEGQWGTVCEFPIDIKTARIVCRQMGLPTSGAVVMMPFHRELLEPVPPDTVIWLDHVNCTGNESNILDCPRKPLGVTVCQRFEDVAIECKELPEGPDQPGDVRLVGGQDNSTGFVEVFWNGIWGTICNTDEFTTLNARVICRQLGFEGWLYSAVLSDFSHLEPSTAEHILLDIVRCSGNELSISQCLHMPWGMHSCPFDGNAAVKCFNYTEPPSVRLVGGTDDSVGYVEVFYNNTWGTVCDDAFTNAAARVVCRQMGFSLGNRVYLPNEAVVGATPTNQIWLDDVECQGDEISISYCGHEGWGQNDCAFEENVAITCTNGTLNYSVSDNGRLRLRGSPNSTTGYLEVLYEGLWGTVCDDFFDDIAAKVACRQMGLPSSQAVMLSDSQKAQLREAADSVPIWLDEVDCYGAEADLLACNHERWGDHNCAHSEDVAITCKESPWSPNLPGRPGNVRLVGGQYASMGFLEVYWNGSWGKVCDSGFSVTVADVVCRQMRYVRARGLIITRTSRLERSLATQFWLDNIGCKGNESSITQCWHSPWGPQDCSFGRNVAMRCVRSTTVSSSGGSSSGASRSRSDILTPAQARLRLTANLLNSIETLDIENIAETLRHGTPPNAVMLDCCGLNNRPTVLICSACLGSFNATLILLSHGASTELTEGSQGATALIEAAKGGYSGVVKLLLAAGANPDAKTSSNETALTLAAYRGHIEVVRELVKSGADIHLKQRTGLTALDLARLTGRSAVVAFLRAAVATVPNPQNDITG